ncbi:response regulator [Hymenobacter sp. 15J16-1T3B]|uniref:response regulator n=1 Tax=Hymenobacter sp. 15J16-1T3B TaxID=2886941 RepID=UPI001D11CF1F|nr:response regulator [Hymenobacter sp. 15J16-1T3B]MCC3156027.1 response regulator [Hymenobacter sp. 15J16-1T3B]
MKTILLIEDHEPMRENTAEILELAGYRVVQAADGKRGVELARSAVPDLVMCDVMMPELDGFGVLHILHQDPTTTDIPFLFLTAKAGHDDLRRAMNAGADDYLTKPFDDTVLLDAVAMRLSKHDARPAVAPPPAASGLRLLQEWMAAPARLKHYKKKHPLYMEGDAPHSVYWLQHGAAKTSKIDKAGNEYITELSSDGQLLGYRAVLGRSDYTDTTVLLTDAAVAQLPHQEFETLLAQHADLARYFWELMAHDAAARDARLLELAYQPVRRRLALALVRFEELYRPMGHLGQGTRIAREDLAALVGASKETVSRTLSDFRAKGLIEVTGQDITILDAPRLRRQQP